MTIAVLIADDQIPAAAAAAAGVVAMRYKDTEPEAMLETIRAAADGNGRY